MSPQPISKVRPNAGGIFNNKALEKYPELAVFPMRVIGIWSHIHFGISTMLGRMLHAEAAIGLAMYDCPG